MHETCIALRRAIYLGFCAAVVAMCGCYKYSALDRNASLPRPVRITLLHQPGQSAESDFEKPRETLTGDLQTWTDTEILVAIPAPDAAGTRAGIDQVDMVLNPAQVLAVEERKLDFVRAFLLAAGTAVAVILVVVNNL